MSQGQPLPPQADHYPESHLVNPTTLLALRKLAHHVNRRKQKRRGKPRHSK